MYEEKINAYFDAPERRAELVEAISRLVRIRSVREEPLPGMPFGPGPAAALAEGLKLAEELGFATRNYDNYVGTADLNDKETALHILCHPVSYTHLSTLMRKPPRNSVTRGVAVSAGQDLVNTGL